jgi:hypothetical protein
MEEAFEVGQGPHRAVEPVMMMITIESPSEESLDMSPASSFQKRSTA